MEKPETPLENPTLIFCKTTYTSSLKRLKYELFAPPIKQWYLLTTYCGTYLVMIRLSWVLTVIILTLQGKNMQYVTTLDQELHTYFFKFRWFSNSKLSNLWSFEKLNCLANYWERIKILEQVDFCFDVLKFVFVLITYQKGPFKIDGY